MQVEPTSGGRPSDGLFVGRQHEIEQLASALREAASGRPRLALLVGEPGIGKTATAQEFAERAGDEGALVLWGSCYEGEGAPAYWPWLQVLRRLVRDLGRDSLFEALGPDAHGLVHLLPEVGMGEHEEHTALPPEQARFRLFDGVANLLSIASAARPVVLIVDDLHWADEPSLLLLEFLARELQAAKVLIVATYRQEELGRQHPLSQVLGRLTMARRLVLAGLGRPDVERFIEIAAGVSPTPPLVDTVHAMTGGNPFFLGEVLRLLASEGKLADDAGALSISIPQGVREVIGRHLAHVSEECSRALTAGSVVGREFGLSVLERVCDMPRDWLLDALAEGVAAGLIEEIQGQPGRFTFAHALVRETLYREPTTVQRIRLHRDAALALEELYGAFDDERLAEMAHHFLEAAPGGDSDRAIEYAMRAAERATTLLAYEESVRFYQSALDVLEMIGGAPLLRLDALLGLADNHWRSGAEPASKAVFARAATLARELGDPERLAHAALGPGSIVVMFGLSLGVPDEGEVRLLEEATALLPPGDTATRVRLLARLAAVLYWVPEEQDRRSRLATQSVEMARRLGDPATLSYALSASLWARWSPDNFEERLASAEEIIALSKGLGVEGLEVLGRIFRLCLLLELGDIQGADAELAIISRLADEFRDLVEMWFERMIQAMRALMGGRIDDAERLANEAMQFGESGGDRSFQTGSYWIQMCTIRVLQGRAAELEPVFRELSEQPSNLPAWQNSLAYVYAVMGRLDDARAAIARCGPIEKYPRDASWTSALANYADVISDLGDAPLAREAYDLLLPYADRCTFTGPGSVFCGSVQGYLGRLAATMGRDSEAEAHFDRALEVNARAGEMRAGLSVRIAYGAMLLDRDGPGDRERAATMLAEARTAAESSGMVLLVEQVDALGAPGGEAPEATSGPNAFRREGEFWTLGFGGSTFRLKDTKGLRYLAALLGRPGVEVHVMELVAATQGETPSRRGREIGREVAEGGLAVTEGAGVDVLDERAKAEYRARLDELREELEEAEANNDPERAARARWEIDAIADQLAAGLGLGGRSRKTSSMAERARVNVRNSIASALRTIRRHDEPLWRHLSNSVRTGAFCAYAPEHPVEWELSG